MAKTELPEVGRDRREITGASVALIALAIVYVGASMSLWRPNNPWNAPAPLPTGRQTESVSWWGILGPDPVDQTHTITNIMVSVLPAIAVALAAIVPLTVRRWRLWFGPLVAAAAAMWLVQILGWTFMYEDYVDHLELGIGFLLIMIGLPICIGAALVDAHEERRWLEFDARRPLPAPMGEAASAGVRR